MSLRQRTYVAEEIPVPIRPGKYGEFLLMFVRKMNAILDTIQRSKAVIDAAGEHGVRAVDSCFQRGNYSEYAIKNALTKGRDHVDHVRDYIEVMKPGQVLEWLGYTKQEFEPIKRMADNAHDYKDFYSDLSDEANAWELGDNFKKAVADMMGAAVAAWEQIEYAEKKIALSIPKFVGWGKREPPKHGDIETLYHASIHAKQILRSGFSKSKPEGFVGLGGTTRPEMGEREGISFTYDLYVAKEISRTFKEMAMAANGDLKARDILSWARRDGIYDNVWKGFISSYGKDIDTPLSAIQMLVTYYFMNKKRYDPFFMTHPERLLQGLKGVNPRDIGVVVARVDMRNVKEGEYVFNEREYRIYPEDIVEIVKVI